MKKLIELIKREAVFLSVLGAIFGIYFSVVCVILFFLRLEAGQ